MGHGHGHAEHGHGHRHGHGDAGQDRRRIAIVLAITVAILVLEVVGAALTGSLALLADAGHLFADSAGLVMALVTAHLMTRPSTDKRTWGFARAEPIGASLQALVLLALGVYIAVEAVQRLITPHQVTSGMMLLVGAIGLIGNVIGLAILMGRRDANLNLRAAFLEVAADALGSVAVIVGAAIIAWTGWTRADAVVSLVIVAMILPRAIALLREAGGILMDSAPAGLDLEEVRRHITAIPHVIGVHDLHASRVSSGLPILSAHIVLEDDCFHRGHIPPLLAHVQKCVAEHFPVSVEHSTFQFEPQAHAAREHEHH